VQDRHWQAFKTHAVPWTPSGTSIIRSLSEPPTGRKPSESRRRAQSERRIEPGIRVSGRSAKRSKTRPTRPWHTSARH